MTGNDKHDKSKKNTVSIHLNESAVFLRTAGPNIRRHQNATNPSMLRGLLVLDLVKPTKITSIEVELVGKTTITWPERLGTRRVDIGEEHEVFHESAVYFQAGETKSRRTASLGPGVAPHDEDHAPEYGEEDDNRDDDLFSNHHSTVESPSHARRPPSDERGRRGRRLSADSSIFQRAPPVLRHGPVMIATPALSPVRSQTSQSTDEPQSIQSFHTTNSDPVPPPVESTPFLQGSFTSPPSSPPYEPPSTPLPGSHYPSSDRIPENEAGPSTPHSPNGSSSDHHHAHTNKHSRFSLAMVSNVLMEVVKPHSPKLRASPERAERAIESAVRGRMLERNAFNKLSDTKEHKDRGASWKEFKKGAYTYPISFTIPGNSPPSMTCPNGSVSWHLRAVVHRPGAFKAKMVTVHRVIVVAYPAEEETESESLVVSRDWDSQLEYMISVADRNFYIGGSIPVTLTLLPLTKVKIYRISIHLEERVDYYTRMKRIIRTDPISRIELVSTKSEGGKSSQRHLLPLESDDPNVLASSPLSKLLNPEDDLSEAVSSYMGPGPWTFHPSLRLPSSCNLLLFTNKNRRSNMTVTHVLKVIIRTTRGDDQCTDAKSGSHKLFDIVISIPIQILSCRCNPEWTALPRYSATIEGATPHFTRCPCEIRRTVHHKEHSLPVWPLERLTQGNEPEADSDSDTDTVQVDADTMLQRNTLFERLVAGRESEMGEAPPAYDGVVQGSSS